MTLEKMCRGIAVSPFWKASSGNRSHKKYRKSIDIGQSNSNLKAWQPFSFAPFYIKESQSRIIFNFFLMPSSLPRINSYFANSLCLRSPRLSLCFFTLYYKLKIICSSHNVGTVKLPPITELHVITRLRLVGLVAHRQQAMNT